MRTADVLVARRDSPSVWPKRCCMKWECTGLCFLSKPRDDLLLLFKRPFMKFIFESHKIVRKPLIF